MSLPNKRKLDFGSETTSSPLRKRIQADFDKIAKCKLDFKDIERMTTPTKRKNSDIKGDLQEIKESIKLLNTNFITLNSNFGTLKLGVEQSLEYTNKIASEALCKATDVKKDIDRVEDYTGKNAIKIMNLEQENKELKERLIKLDSIQRRNQVILEGITEIDFEDSSQLYHKVCSALNPIFGENTTRIPISYIERLGIKGSRNNNTRPVNIHFTCINDCEYVLQNKRYLPNGIYIRQNYPPEIEERRSQLLPILKKAQSLPTYKKKCKLVGDKLIINSKEYTKATFNQLPSELNPANACQNTNQKTLAFFGYGSAFSNFHHSPFLLNGKAYVNVEQYIQSKKAEKFNDEQNQRKIMASKNPAEMKAISKHIRNYNHEEWLSDAKKVAMEGARAKFDQNIELKNQLKLTGDRTLGEATLDKFWGIGLKLHQPNTLIEDQWKGQNVMGNILMEIRSSL